MFSPPPKIACINDLKKLAQKRVPKMFLDYASSGSYSQQTLKWNCDDFDKIKLRQRVAVDVSKRSTKPQDSTVKKKNPVLEDKIMFPSSSASSSSLPIALSPIGLWGMQHVNGEIEAAKAAAKHQVPFTLSTMSITSIEDLRKYSGNDLGNKFFFQLYMMKDRDFMKRLIERARAADCGALVLTLDLQILGVRYADIYNGLSAPPKLYNLRTVKQLARCPRWCIQQALFAKRYNFGNIVEDPVLASKVDDVSSLSAWTSGQFDPSVDWDTVRWIRNEVWKDRPLIVKGILDENDAIEACKAGCDAILVSNHGGRQLDGTPSSISRLHHIKKAVQSYGESTTLQNNNGNNNLPAIHFDGGVSTGQHVFKALALGASCVWIGRSYVAGLGAMGERGVDLAIECLQKELDVTMALTGTSKLDEIGLDKLIMSDEVKKEFGISLLNL